MILGMLLIVSGILIAIFPTLLSLIVSSFMILSGILVLLLAYEYRHHARRGSMRTINTLFRY
jgi:cytochrome bd-type quinol oxidase subunit 2